MNTTRSREQEGTRSMRPLWVFTPSRTDPADLEFILVQRQRLLQDAVERVKESVLTAHKHHQLFVGPRGCGKTHLATLIVSRLASDVTLSDRLRIAWLNEDETCTTLLEFLLKIHAALAKRHPSEFNADQLAAAYELKPAEARSFVMRSLLEAVGGNTVLVLTENLDAIFENLGVEGQQQLRAFIQQHPRLTIVATAQRLVEDLSSRTRPFFGFFQTEHLKPLGVADATRLLQNIAELQGKSDVVAFLATSRGRARVRALHHLSGGNHRIYIVLAQFISEDSLDGLLGPFMKMVDELTPYYQERVRWLPALQRKIVEYLCVCEETAPVKEIARKLFASPQTVSSQLKELREKGYVEASQRGRESLYEVSEPLMRICVEVKDVQAHQPLRLLVDFLRVWYDDHDLRSRLEQARSASGSHGYLQAAIEQNASSGNIRKTILVRELESSVMYQRTADDQTAPAEDLNDLPEGALEALQSLEEGDLASACRCLNDAVAEEVDQARRNALVGKLVGVLSRRADKHYESRDFSRAVEDLTAVIALGGAPVEEVARALVTRGFTHGQQGEPERAIADYTAVLALSLVPPVQHLWAYTGIAEEHARAGRWSEATASLEAGLNIGRSARPTYLPPPFEFVGILFSLGLSRDDRRSRATELVNLYATAGALNTLGEALVAHIGSLFRAGAPWPSADNLEQWADAWEQAASEMPDFRLSMRLLRTGVDFIKAGGERSGVLLSLTSAEREIMRQALGLDRAES